MKLSSWARQQGLSYKTAWRLRKAGKLPVPAEQLATDTAILHAAPVNEPPGVEAVQETGSGLNGGRKALLRILGNPTCRSSLSSIVTG